MSALMNASLVNMDCLDSSSLHRCAEDDLRMVEELTVMLTGINNLLHDLGVDLAL